MKNMASIFVEKEESMKHSLWIVPFKSRIVILESEIVLHSNDPIAPVGYLKLNKLQLENKLPLLNLHERLKGLPLKNSDGYVTDPGEDVKDMNEEESDSDSLSEPVIRSGIYTVARSMGNQNYSVQKSPSGWLWVGGIRGESIGNPMDNAMSTLESCLSNYDQDLTNVCSITLYISNMQKFSEVNTFYCHHINFPNPPTRACVEVPLNENCPLILEAVSWRLPEKISCDPAIERNTMYVQSRSHWAPANIGPYSQTVKVGELIHLSGQIGLVPGNLKLVEGGVKCQCRLALRHVDRLLKAVDNNINLRNVVQGICYVTNIKSIQQVRRLWEENTNNAIVDYVVVSNLPKCALVEWHVWAHRFNHLFEYEETGRCIDDKNWSISIFRRWNYENNISAIVCHLEKTNGNEDGIFDEDIFSETVDYTLLKLKQGYESDQSSVSNLKIFYPVTKHLNIHEYFNYLDNLRKYTCLTYTMVPVIFCKMKIHIYPSVEQKVIEC
ncbi:hypothetical protein HHI36_009971 [Cryptolaemus montrouzieri]|uniref:Uncharacterized protein n=1 Tax=Cryptolaemus montrouzieri TaxID=559131 RepID=A0ABD2MHG5_9CUCU